MTPAHNVAIAMPATRTASTTDEGEDEHVMPIAEDPDAPG